MKKIYIFLLTLLLVACVEQNTKFSNPVQQRFDDLLAKNKFDISRAANDIKKEEIQNNFETVLTEFLDSVILFVGFKGTISNIQLRDERSNKSLSFKITYKPEENREITFYCSRLFESGKLENFELYNSIKELSNHSTVYLDGVIRRNSDNSIIYDIYSLYDSMMKHLYPKYRFFPLAVTSKDNGHKLPENLMQLIRIDSEVISIAGKETDKEVSSGSFSKIVEQKKDEAQALFRTLTPEQKEYRNHLFGHTTTRRDFNVQLDLYSPHL